MLRSSKWLSPPCRGYPVSATIDRVEHLRSKSTLLGLILGLALVLAACSTPANDADAADVTPADTIPPVEEDEGARDVGEAIPFDESDDDVDDVPVPTPSEINAALGRGINLGNALDGPRETTWGPGLEAEYFTLISEQGFDHVRLPVSWAGYADTNAPYLIPDDDPTIDHDDYNSIWERVDWAIEQAAANDLMIIVNMHHYDELHADIEAESPRFLAMWEQISERLAGAGDHVILEILNEPNGQFNPDPQPWNDLFAETLEIVREDHPTRTVVVGPTNFNAVTYLEGLELPDDPYLLGTVHVYVPFEFTHQGAVFADPIPPVGTGWAPDYIGVAEGLSNGSWDTNIAASDGGLAVSYTAQWTGFGLDLDNAFAPTSLSFSATGQTGIRVGCRNLDDSVELVEVQLSGTSTPQVIDLSTCPSTTTGVFLQNTGEGAREIVIQSMSLCTAEGCQDLLSTQQERLEDHFAIAAEWSERTGIPLNLGEFGAFAADGQAPLADRAEWTATIVDIATSHGMSTSYWEFYSGFGVFDVETETWETEILDSLLG